MSDATEPTTDAIDAYLDRLLGELRGDPREIRRILAEIEGHLRDGVDAGTAEGLSGADAQHRAIERCGSPSTVARRFAADNPGRLLSLSVLRPLFLAAVLLSGVGLVAIGASGAVAGGMGAVNGKRFVSGDQPGYAYPAARCAYFVEYYPSQRTCEAAATAHHFDEVVTYRVAAGLVGLLVLGAYGWRRRRRDVASLGLLPDGFVATIGTIAFGTAGVFLIGYGLDQIVLGQSAGAGQYLSGGVIALPLGVAFGISLLRTLARRAGSAVVG